jgi:hypothetical protein
MCSPEEARAVENELTDWFLRNERKTHECLLNAAVLFRTIRNQSNMSFYDPFCFLVASLYIWAYSRVIGKSILLSENKISADECPGKHPIRIDQDIDDTLRNFWIDNADRIPAHITGIGIINGPESGTLVLKEAVRVLNRSGSWTEICHTMSQALKQAIAGGCFAFEES